jgi:hypothetical protein
MSEKRQTRRGCGWQVMIAFICLLLAITVLSGLYKLLPKFVDFPCGASYNATDQCLERHGPDIKTPPDTKIQIFASEHMAGWNGAACDADSSSSNTLDYDAEAWALHFELQGDELLLNGKPLPVDEVYEKYNYASIDPWAKADVSVWTPGKVVDCEASEPVERWVVLGYHGTRVSLGKGAIVLAVLVAALVLTAVRLKKVRRIPKKAAAGEPPVAGSEPPVT